MQPQGEAGAPPRKRPMFQLPSLSEVLPPHDPDVAACTPGAL